MNRLEYLLQLHQEQPNDPFLVYGIALEYKKTDSNQTPVFFDLLLTAFPDYLATYYQAAEYFTEKGFYEKALEIYDTGIHLATSLNEMKTLAELKNAKQNLEIDLM
jgi:tetratricopeptide (TPR) repeat protein